MERQEAEERSGAEAAKARKRRSGSRAAEARRRGGAEARRAEAEEARRAEAAKARKQRGEAERRRRREGAEAAKRRGRKGAAARERNGGGSLREPPPFRYAASDGSGAVFLLKHSLELSARACSRSEKHEQAQLFAHLSTALRPLMMYRPPLRGFCTRRPWRSKMTGAPSSSMTKRSMTVVELSAL